jgi:hypothetical protein
MPFEDRCKALTNKIAEVFQDINQLNPFILCDFYCVTI